MSRRRAPWRRPVPLLLVAALVLGGVWVAIQAGRGTDDGSVWIAAARRDLVVEIELTGTLKAVESVSLGPPQLASVWDFKVSHMAPEGSEVREGDPVLSFDTSDLEQRLRRQIAEADQARKQIDKTRKNLEMRRRETELNLAEARGRRSKAAVKVDVPDEFKAANELQSGRLDLDLADREVRYLESKLDDERRSAEAQVAALEAQRARAERQVDEIRDAIEKMTRLAPREATVVHVANWRDEKKKVGDSVWRGDTVIELPDLTRMEGDGQVDEADAGRLAVAQPVRLRLDAHPDHEFTGKVERIRRTVQRESRRNPQKVVRLDVALDETDVRRMRPGMRFRGSIELERVEQALLIPISAPRPGADGPWVEVRRWSGSERRAIELGRRDGDFIEVLSGLEEGDRVAISNTTDESGEWDG